MDFAGDLYGRGSVRSLPVNQGVPYVMHIDLNSAFAMAEQQANPLLRGKPVGITNRASSSAICITSSYEARRLGIGVGTRLREARQVAPDFVMVESDPAKYQYINARMRTIFESYSPVAYMKSVDEGIIDFRSVKHLLRGRSLAVIADEIKQRVRDEIGSYMTVNIGVGHNKWLAKLAAGFLKPNGFYCIDHNNLELVYGLLRLEELPYIKQRNRLRLNGSGIYTPIDFLRASPVVLAKEVFRSVLGYQWYLKLRGYETDVDSVSIRTVGRSYVLEHRTDDLNELRWLLYRMSTKVARRLRSKGLAARGLSLYIRYESGERLVNKQVYQQCIWRSDSLYERVKKLFDASFLGGVVTAFDMVAYKLEVPLDQISLYEDDATRRLKIEEVMNLVNDTYGELVLAPAAAVSGRNEMRDKVPFGSVRYFDL